MNSFIGWIGGKKLLREEVIKRFPEKMGRYIEVFGGAAWVLFHKEKHADFEVYNDYNSDLVNLFRCVKYHCGELQRELSCLLTSRELFEDFKAQYNTRGMTDIQKAARFFMLIKTSYGSDSHTFGCIKKNINHATEYLEAIQQRLMRVVVENKSYENLIKVYDRPDAVFYLDPPYVGTEKYYAASFTKEDHLKLREILGQIKGKFILSYNDCEEVRTLYGGFNIDSLSRSHNLTQRFDAKEKRYNEVIISNT
jgi:DNA adenine methylase